MSSQNGRSTILIHLFSQRFDSINIHPKSRQFLLNIKIFRSRASHLSLSSSSSIKSSQGPKTSSWPATTKMLYLSVTDKPQTKSRSLEATPVKKSSGVLGTRDGRIPGIWKKWVRTSYSPPSNKKACLVEPSSTGVDRLSPWILLVGK